ncbi:hypothetical protein EJV46_14690 [Roseococcus sp. SYP-B2431]|uniref:hypothetical protein n=1 Tax=Roseococcus sp. SYP-B2431 TaxID=2496640 RepID=UPI0010408646|nr:hypothetical protein [Roseococcus sp. SYP-B2431]TCH97382.1 hypothetical protein EJV46_14690 [Roseococcus sp. SYP-B2431]
MSQWFRRSILTGLAGALPACASHDEPRASADWLLGQWQGGIEGQFLAVTAVEAEKETAQGAWAGAPVSIILTGSRLRFVTADGYAVHLAHAANSTLIGTIDRAPWLVQARDAIGFVALRRVA